MILFLKLFSSAKITTKNKVDFQKGYLEVVAKLPNAVGTWPAIWMLPTLDRSLNWPLDGEIDIMENVGYDSCKILGTIHTKAYNHTINTQKSDSVVISTAHQDFHTYSLNWTDSILEWYVDSNLYNSIIRKSTDREEQWPFDKPFHLIINQAVGGDWGGRMGVDTSSFPENLIIDRVKLYNKKPFLASDYCLSSCNSISITELIVNPMVSITKGIFPFKKQMLSCTDNI